MFSDFKLKVKKLKREIGALYLAARRKDVPWYSKLVILLVVGYALSPIDLIPDFIPVLGLVDDLILLPLGITLAIRLIPGEIMKECREQSEDIFKDGKPKNWYAAAAIILIWIVVLLYFVMKLLEVI